MPWTPRQSRLLGTSNGSHASVVIAAKSRNQVRTTQPQGVARIDWSNPITQGLVDVSVPFDLVTSVNNPIYVVKPKGLAFKGNGSPNCFYKAKTVKLGSKNTIFALVHGVNTTSDGRIYSASSTLNNTPLFSLGSQPGGASVGYCFYRPNSQHQISGTPIIFENEVEHTPAIVCSTERLEYYVDGRLNNYINGSIGSFEGVYLDRIGIGAAIRSTISAYNNSGLLLGLMWARCLSPTEIKSLSDNPWQIFASDDQPIWVPV